MARPKKTGPKRDAKLDVRLTKSQKAAVEKAARLATLDPSVWGRMVILRATEWDPKEDDETDSPGVPSDKKIR